VLISRALDPETYSQFQLLFHRAGAAMNVAYQIENSLSIVKKKSTGELADAFYRFTVENLRAADTVNPSFSRRRDTRALPGIRSACRRARGK
jgi:hypothetical protein